MADMADTPTGSAPRPDGMPGEPWHPELEPFTDQRPQGPDAAALVKESERAGVFTVADPFGYSYWQSGSSHDVTRVGSDDGVRTIRAKDKGAKGKGKASQGQTQVAQRGAASNTAPEAY